MGEQQERRSSRSRGRRGTANNADVEYLFNSTDQSGETRLEPRLNVRLGRRRQNGSFWFLGHDREYYRSPQQRGRANLEPVQEDRVPRQIVEIASPYRQSLEPAAQPAAPRTPMQRTATRTIITRPLAPGTVQIPVAPLQLTYRAPSTRPNPYRRRVVFDLGDVNLAENNIGFPANFRIGRVNNINIFTPGAAAAASNGIRSIDLPRAPMNSRIPRLTRSRGRSRSPRDRNGGRFRDPRRE